MATTAEIRNKALIKLGVLSADGTADSNDASLLDDSYADLYQLFVERDVATWGPSDDVPAGAVNAVATILAERHITDFKIPTERALMLGSQVDSSWDQLNELVTISYVSSPVQADYF